MRHASTIFGLLAACGGGGNNPDAPIHDTAIPDTRAIDSAVIDGTSVDSPMAMGVKHHYVASTELVPTSSTEARNYGLDLNGDGVVDNQFGMVLATFANQGVTTQATVTTSIDHGTSIILAELETTDFATATNAGFTLYQGANPQPPACTGAGDTICRHHLTGSASFTVPAGAIHDPLLVGDFVGGTLTTPVGGGKLPVTLAFGNPFTVELVAARTSVTAASATGFTAVVAGAILQSQLDTTVYPAFQASLTTAIQRDCTGGPPSCGCASNSGGASAIGLFDTDHSCTVSIDEIKNNQIIIALFMPDLMVDGMPAISVGVKLTAVAATFTP